MRHSLIVLLLLLVSMGSMSQNSEQPELMLREAWNAQPAKEGLKWHIPRYITIHHTGTFQNKERTPEEKLQALQKFSFTEGILGDGVTPKNPGRMFRTTSILPSMEPLFKEGKFSTREIPIPIMISTDMP